MKLLLISSAALLASLSTGVQAARSHIEIVGSSTVYPFATTVAEIFGKTSNFKTPKVESTGSGGGFKLFCSGAGVNSPDITNASRRVKSSEIELCKKNGVESIVEVKIGYDGIVIANSKKAVPMKLSLRDIYLALAKEVPATDGSEKLVINYYKTWQDVNPELPATAIEVLGPPPTSGTRDAFVELAMEGGCKTYPWIKAMKKQDKKLYKARCHTIREDGAYVEAGENDNLIVQKLEANPKALGIFGFSFLEQNSDKVQGATVNGVAPEFETIADSRYPISRPLYFYVKTAHATMIPGMQEYLAEFTSEKAWGEDGYLSDKGLIPMPEDERAQFSNDVKNLIPLTVLK